MMKEFAQKEIALNIIKLDNNCNKMIGKMKEAYPEIEVTDMALIAK
mgnify:FL=1